MTVYRLPKEAPVPGQPSALRLKTWRTLPGMVIAQDDKLWAARCKQYWELQGRLFGWRMSDFTMIVDATEGFVSTYCTVLEVLPGERTADHSRVPVEATGVQSVYRQ